MIVRQRCITLIYISTLLSIFLPRNCISNENYISSPASEIATVRVNELNMMQILQEIAINTGAILYVESEKLFNDPDCFWLDNFRIDLKPDTEVSCNILLNEINRSLKGKARIHIYDSALICISVDSPLSTDIEFEMNFVGTPTDFAAYLCKIFGFMQYESKPNDILDISISDFKRFERIQMNKEALNGRFNLRNAVLAYCRICNLGAKVSIKSNKILRIDFISIEGQWLTNRIRALNNSISLTDKSICEATFKILSGRNFEHFDNRKVSQNEQGEKNTNIITKNKLPSTDNVAVNDPLDNFHKENTVTNSGQSSRSIYSYILTVTLITFLYIILRKFLRK